MSPTALRRRATQKDIAQALGISQAAVAMALNPKSQSKLMPETVELVQAKAREMNYSPQRQASILRSGRSHTIGVVFASGLYHAPQERVKQLALAATTAGYQLVAADVDWFQRDYRKVAEYLIGAAAEGVIFCNLYDIVPEDWTALREGWPLLFLSCYQRGQIDRASSDQETAFYEMTLHHLDQGSKKLTLLLPYYDSAEARADRLLSSSVTDRIHGFQRAILERNGAISAPGIEHFFGAPERRSKRKPTIEGTIVYTSKTDAFDNVFELGIHHIRQLIDKNASLPDSIVCANDDIALGVLGECQRHGIRVPDQIKLSGADDAPFARYGGVPLTTIAQSSEQIAKYSVERIVSLIENPALQKEPLTRLFPCRLLMRQSTQAPL